MKKILMSLFILFSLFFCTNSFASWATWSWLESPKYKIDTSELFGTTNTIKQTSAKATVDKWLTVIVEKLMIAFWVLALLIMTIGWGYMIFAAGQDELLNKWKSIFNSWLIALLVALGSWIIMKIVIYLLY